MQENRLYQRMTERRNLHRLLDDATFVSHAVELQQAISDKAEYRVNHDATFVLATFDSPMANILRKMSMRAFIPHLSMLGIDHKLSHFPLSGVNERPKTQHFIFSLWL